MKVLGELVEAVVIGLLTSQLALSDRIQLLCHIGLLGDIVLEHLYSGAVLRVFNGQFFGFVFVVKIIPRYSSADPNTQN